MTDIGDYAKLLRDNGDGINGSHNRMDMRFLLWPPDRKTLPGADTQI